MTRRLPGWKLRTRWEAATEYPRPDLLPVNVDLLPFDFG